MANSRSKIEEIQRQLESELNRLLEANRKLTTREGWLRSSLTAWLAFPDSRT